MTLLKSLDNHSVDLCVTDPPYGESVGKDAHRINPDTYDDDYDDSAESYFKLIKPVIPELARVMKPGAHVYMFCSINKFYDLAELFKAEGFHICTIPLIWHKQYEGISVIPATGVDFYPARGYEAILYALAPGDRRKLSWRGLSNVLSHKVVAPNKKRHPMQKPGSLWKDILFRSRSESGVMIDPFCGSGTSLIAAMEMKMINYGAEIRPGYRASLVKYVSDVYGVVIKEITND
jgi:site-specific DNA-methyltransferase (adenine-specific)